MRLSWGHVAVALALLGCGGCAHRVEPTQALRSESAPVVEWRSWGPEAFEHARNENKLILIDVVADWCHWCHVMDEKTYRAPEVRRILDAHFVVIRVEADARPDVAERYIAWGWPATAILTPDARPVMELRGYQPADRFAPLIDGLAHDHAEGRVTGRRAAPIPAPESPDLAATRDALTKHLDGMYDARQGGWGFKQKYPVGPMLEHALRRAHGGDPLWRGRALQTLEGTEQLIDPVWGGIYQYSVGGVWNRPHYEKITKQQALTIDTLTMASLELGDERWLDDASSIVTYMDEHMRDPDGGYWAARDADLRKPARGGRTETVEGRAFYALDDAGRRALGEPMADERVFAELNGLLLAALSRYAGATGEPDDGQRAMDLMDLMDALETRHRDEHGLFRHAATAPESGDPRRYLADQAAMLWGLVALHEFTGDPAVLDDATRLADATIDALGDGEEAGFYGVSADPSASGVFAERQKPLEANALLARGLLRLHHLHHARDDSKYRRAALGALRTLSDRSSWLPRGRFAGPYLLALEEALEGPIVFTVVAEPGDPMGRALASAVLRVHEPRRILQRSRPGEIYPDRGQAALYLCTDTACSPPIREPAAVADAVLEFRR